MISRWLISFSLAVSSSSLAIVNGATVAGSISLSDSRDPAVRSAKDFSGVVVWLEAVGGTIAPVSRLPLRAQILQKNKRFIPHILAVQTGTTVDFPNYDPIFHNAFSNFEG